MTITTTKLASNMIFLKLQGRYWHFAILVWIFFVYLNGIANFSFSFLLSKATLENVSLCDGFVSSKPFESIFDQYDSSSTVPKSKPCWLPASFSKAIIILIDGLRFDFAYSTKGKPNETTPYLGKMPVFEEILTKKPRNSFMAPFVADPPTTTLQRLQGLTTGTLPTFIDISANFGGEAVNEDNLIKQMALNGKKTIFMGDDTWKNLFPDKFHKSYFYPSFNVKDLNTVDDGILTHLYPQMEKSDEWDILIAHFLGVDHCGHRYGPSHPEMTRKLRQMDEVIRKVIQSLPKDTVLYVIGDHGMTQTGDHGGDSQMEINSTLFIFSKETLHGEKVNLKMNGVPQVNLVPTISLHMGLPIPFSNLGSVISETFIVNPSSKSGRNNSAINTELLNELFTFQALNQNANQIRRYFQTYKNQISPSFNSNEFEILEKLWINSNDELENLLSGVNKEQRASDNNNKGQQVSLERIRALKKLQMAYLNGMLKAFSEKWAKFNMVGMIIGLFIVMLGTIIVVMLLIETSQRSLHLYIVGNIAFVSLILSVPLTAIYCYAREENAIFKNSLNAGCFLSLGSSFVYLCWSVFKSHGDPQETSNSGKLSVIFNLFCPIIHACGLFSNSFVINEDKTSSFLLQSLLMANTLRIIAQSFATKKLNPKNPLMNFNLKIGAIWMALFTLSTGLVRAGDFFRKCREEKGPLCQSSNFLLSIATIPENWSQYRGLRLFEAIILLAIITGVFKIVWKKGKHLYRHNLTALLVQYFIPFATLCIGASWILDFASKETVKKFLPNKQELPAQTATITTLLIPVAIFAFPISISYDITLIKRKLFRFHWTMLLNYGPILISLSLLACLLSGDGLSLGIIICLVSMATWGFIWATNQQSEHASINTEEDHGSIFAVAAILASFASHLFYSTGHQAAFPAIHWNAAFVLSSGENYGRIAPAIAVIYETFFSQVIAVGALFSVISLREVFVKSDRVSMNPESIANTTVRGILPSSNINAVLSKGRLSRYENSLLCLQLSFIFMQSLKLLSAMASSFVLRRHLMVWKIFAPRLIFEEISFIVIAVAFVAFQLLNIKILRTLDKL